MGYYINQVGNSGLPAKGKADELLKIVDCFELTLPPVKYSEIGPKEALICVVENGPFDAAALVYNEGEFNEFMVPDHGSQRPRRWILMDKKTAYSLAGYREKVS